MSQKKALLFLVCLFLPALLAGVPDGLVERVSVNSYGTQGDLDSSSPRITPDGRFLLFESLATNLSPQDTNGRRDVFRRDLATRQTILVSAGTSGNSGNGDSFRADISNDGQTVVFESEATDLVGLRAIGSNIFVRDVRAAKTFLVSIDWRGDAGGEGESFFPQVTPDGRFVLFESTAYNLIENNDSNGKRDVFVRDLQSSRTTLVSATPSGNSANGDSGAELASITPDGRYVFFQSSATDLVPGGVSGIYRRDLVNNTTILVAGNSRYASVSDDGRRVTFTTNQMLSPLDTNITEDIYYAVILPSGRVVTSLVSALPGRPAVGGSGGSVTSADGNFVAFNSYAPLLPEDTNGLQDVYLQSLVDGTTTLVSAAADGGSGQGESFLAGDPSLLPGGILSDDGRYLVFESTAGNLVDPPITPGTRQIFLRNLATNTTLLLSRSLTGQGGNFESLDASIARGGSAVVFESGASNLVTSDDNSARDIFAASLTGLRERAVVTPESLSFGAVPVGGSSQQTVTLTNAGESALLVRSVMITGPDSSGFSTPGGMGSFSLAPGGIQPLIVRFIPSAAGPQRAVLRIESSDPDGPLDVDLSGGGLSPGGPNVFATKEAVGALVAGAEVTYVVRLVNAGAGAQPDNPGDELLDTLPSPLVLLGATASSGTATVNTGTNTVTWNGPIAAAIPGNLPEIVLTIRAQIPSGLATGTLITNQGSVFYDADGNPANGNEGVRLTDDPTVSGAANGTSFQVRSVVEIPALAPLGLLALALFLAGAALVILRFRA